MSHDSPRHDSRLRHHDLCFGCGQTNLFGLQLEVERRPDGGVAGRFFLKQDHQGPPGYAHGGVLAAALDEAMSLVIHSSDSPLALAARLEVDLHRPAPIGTFVEIAASAEEPEGRRTQVAAVARDPQDQERAYATARGTYVAVERIKRR